MPVLELIGVAALGWVASPLVAKLLGEGFGSSGIDAEKKLKKMKKNIVRLLKSVIEKAEGSPHRSEAQYALDLLKRKAAAAAAAAVSCSKRRTNPVRAPFHVPKQYLKWAIPVLKGGRDMLSAQKIKLKRRLNCKKYAWRHPCKRKLRTCSVM